MGFPTKNNLTPKSKYSDTDRVILVLVMAGLIGIIIFLIFSIQNDPVLAAKVRPSWWPQSDEDEEALKSLTERHRDLLLRHRQQHDARPHHPHPLLHIQNHHDGNLTKSRETLHRISDTSDPLYHGNVFRDLLPTAFLPLRSVKRDDAVADILELKMAHKPSRTAAHLSHLHQQSFMDTQQEMTVPALVIHVDAKRCEEGSLRLLLESVDVPFRHLVLVLNKGNDDDDDDDDLLVANSELLYLQQAGAVSVIRPSQEPNGKQQPRSFAEAINFGLRRARDILRARSEFDFIQQPFSLESRWYLILSCSSILRPGVLGMFALSVYDRIRYDKMAARINQHYSPVGVFFPRREMIHSSLSCFVLLDSALRTAGYFNEAIYSPEFEFVDFMWRVRLAGFRDMRIESVVIPQSEKQSNNNHDGDASRIQNSAAWELMVQIWGAIPDQSSSVLSLLDSDQLPPSGRDTPFGLSSFPLHLWAVDPVQRHCVVVAMMAAESKTQHQQQQQKSSDDVGPKFLRSDVCWYNFTNSGLLKIIKRMSRKGDKFVLPQYLREPTVPLRGSEGLPSFLIFFVMVVVLLLVSIGCMLMRVEEKKTS